MFFQTFVKSLATWYGSVMAAWLIALVGMKIADSATGGLLAVAGVVLLLVACVGAYLLFESWFAALVVLAFGALGWVGFSLLGYGLEHLKELLELAFSWPGLGVVTVLSILIPLRVELSPLRLRSPWS